MNYKVNVIQTEESFEKMYDVDNNTCPICGEKLTTLTNIVKIGKAAFHMQCYLDATIEVITTKNEK